MCFDKFTRTGTFYTKVTIDGQILGIVCNANPLTFQDVKVWAALPNSTQYYPLQNLLYYKKIYPPVANAKIRNFLINGEKLTLH